MYYYLIGAIIILILLVFIFIYMYKKISLISAFDKLKNKFVKVLIKLVLLFLPFIVFGFINGVVIIFHFAIFLGIFDLINISFKKKYAKAFNYIAIIISTVYLLIGLYNNYHIFETIYNIETNKDIEVSNFRIVQLSDTHTGNTFDGDKLKDIVNHINLVNPDLVVVTGDLVDDNTSYDDMVKTCSALGLFKSKYGVYFAYGNHDKGYYAKNYSASDLERELKKNKVIILEDEIANITDKIVLIGRRDREDKNRLSIDKLTDGIDKNKFIIDLNHQPNDYENESKSIVDLVLSGHTHGGQLIPLGPIGVLTNANDESSGMHKINNTTFIINEGLSSWAIKFKTGAKSEYTVINIRGKNE